MHGSVEGIHLSCIWHGVRRVTVDKIKKLLKNLRNIKSTSIDEPDYNCVEIMDVDVNEKILRMLEKSTQQMVEMKVTNNLKLFMNSK